MLHQKGIRVNVQRGAVRPRAACFNLFFAILIFGSPPVAAGQMRSAAEVHAEKADPDCTSGCQGISSGLATLEGPNYRGYPGWDSGTPGMKPSRPDEAVLYWVNQRQNALFTRTMHVADVSFYPVIYGSIPAYWATALLSDDVMYSNAVSYSVGWAATAGSTLLLKRLIGRERPFVSRRDLVIRYSDSELKELGVASSMPSGHSSMSVFAASYLAMQVDTPAAHVAGSLWASSVVVSRVWNGVHFPSDVLAGSALGVGVALLVRQLD